MQYQAQADMSDPDDGLREICREIHALEAIRLEALALAPGLAGDAEKIAKVWRGTDGLQARVAKALEPIGQVDDVRANRLYDEACRGLWAVLWAGERVTPMNPSQQDGLS